MKYDNLDLSSYGKLLSLFYYVMSLGRRLDSDLTPIFCAEMIMMHIKNQESRLFELFSFYLLFLSQLRIAKDITTEIFLETTFDRRSYIKCNFKKA